MQRISWLTLVLVACSGAEDPAGQTDAGDPEAPNAAATSFPSDVEIDDVLIFAGCSAIDGAGGTLAVSNHSAAINSVSDTTLREQLRTRYEGLEFQPWTGWISFDCGENWFFDPTPATVTDLPANRPDFLSTANHELGHVLGFGTAMAYFAHVSNATFTGAQAIDTHGERGSADRERDALRLGTELKWSRAAARSIAHWRRALDRDADRRRRAGGSRLRPR